MAAACTDPAAGRLTARLSGGVTGRWADGG